MLRFFIYRCIMNISFCNFPLTQPLQTHSITHFKFCVSQCLEMFFISLCSSIIYILSLEYHNILPFHQFSVLMLCLCCIFQLLSTSSCFWAAAYPAGMTLLNSSSSSVCLECFIFSSFACVNYVLIAGCCFFFFFPSLHM